MKIRSWEITDFYTLMTIAASLMITKVCKQPKCWQQIKKDISINEILFSHDKEGDPAICGNMDASWGYYAKWNKSDRERQILYDLTYMWNLEKMNSRKQWVDWLLPGAEDQDKWGDFCQRVQTSSYKIDKFWGSNV